MPRPHGRPVVRLTDAQRTLLERLRTVLGTAGEWMATSTEVDEKAAQDLARLALVELRAAGDKREYRARPFEVKRRPDPAKSAELAPRPKLPGECRVPASAEQEAMAKEFPGFVQPAKPDCPRCGESDRVRREGDNDDGSPAWWCNRCFGYLAALDPLPGRYAPDFPGTPFEPRGTTPETVAAPVGLPPEPADRQQLPELDRALYTALRSCQGRGSFWDDVRRDGATDAELTAKIAEAFGIAAGVSQANAEPFCWRGYTKGEPDPQFWFGTNLGRSICYSADGKLGTIPPTLSGAALLKAARRLLGIARPRPKRKKGEVHVKTAT